MSISPPTTAAGRFEFAAAGRIVFGAGTSAQAAGLIGETGLRGKIFALTGSQPQRHAALLTALAPAGTASVAREPEIAEIQRHAARARELGCAVIVGIGGGSVIDAAKAIAAAVANPGDMFEFLEVIGKGRALEAPALPIVAIPTTAGTGSEATRNAVLASPEHRVKVSLRHASLLPRLAIVDPTLALGAPAALTAGAGCDALTQLIEPFLCNRANPLTDAFCREGIPLVARSLRRACEHPDDLGARTDMAIASLLGGMALANAGLGAVHGLANPLGGAYHAPHGAVCGILLAPVMEANLRAASAAAFASPSEGRSGASAHSGEPTTASNFTGPVVTVHRFGEITSLLTGGVSRDPASSVITVREWVARLNIPHLSTYGITPEAYPQIAQAALRSSSMKANPMPLNEADLISVLQAAA